MAAPQAYADVPTPRIKPAAPNASQYLSDRDAKRFRKGVSAARAGRWTELNQNIRQLDDPIATDTLKWVRACLLYTSPSPRDLSTSRMPSSA